MTRRGILRLCLWVALCVFSIVVPSAQSRVIGIFFDDSGSMAPRIHLPTFGAQLLVSTLDGRPGHDRLFTIRLSQALQALGYRGQMVNVPPGGVNADNVEQWIAGKSNVITEEVLGAQDAQQHTLDTIKTTWPFANVDTPYEPLEIILDKLTQSVAEDDEAILVVLTDGNFDPRPPSADRARASFLRYAGRLAAKRARLRVEFLLIAPNDPDTIREVHEQGIRDALLETFNGSSNDGSHEVTQLSQLNEALKDVIAAVAATDHRQQGRYIAAGTDTLTIDTPLSLSRIISVSTGLASQPLPMLVGAPPGTSDRRSLQTAMAKSDTAPAIANQRLVGSTEQLYFDHALQAGHYVLSYNRPLDNKVFLLFETGAFTDVRILKPDGTPADRDGNTYVLVRGAPYTLEARLMDIGPSGPIPVKLSSIQGQSRFTGLVQGTAGTASIDLTAEMTSNRAAGAFSLASPGTALARVTTALEGFVSPGSKPVPLRVVDNGVAFDMRLRGIEPCPKCAANEFASALDPGGRPHPFAILEITPRGGSPTGILDLSHLPAFVSVAAGGGAAMATGSEVSGADGKKIELELRTDGKTMPPGERQYFSIGIAAKAPLVGHAEAAGVLVMHVPVASFDLRLRPTESCPQCGPNQFQATINPQLKQSSPATLEIVPHLEQPGVAAVDLSGLPAGIVLARPGGAVMQQGDELPVRDGVPVSLELRADVAALGENARRPFRIGINARPPSVGRGEIAAELIYVVPEAKLTYTGHSGPAPNDALHVTGTDLQRGAQTLNFRLESAISPPVPGEFKVTGGSSLLDHRVAVDGRMIRLTPVSSWWCVCFIQFWPKQSITLEWRLPSGLQSANATVEYEVAPVGQEVLWSCGRLLLYLLLLIWLIMAILTALRTRRFPRGSIAEVTEGRQLPRNIDLRRSNWTFLRSLLPWRAWLLRPPHERTTIEGIVLEAAPNGASILVRLTTAEYMVVHLGQNSRDMLAANPALDRISIMWNAEIERDVGVLLTVRLLRRMSDQSLHL